MEELRDEIGECESFHDDLSAAIAGRKFPNSYDQNKVVLEAPIGTRVLTVSMFIDGVPYSQIDGVIGFWLVNTMTRRRHLFATLRKYLVCRCGCRGWCTYYAIFDFIAWQFRCFAEGRFPNLRHDGSMWRPDDDERAALADTDLGCRVCLQFTKGDWVEYASTLGFPGHGDGTRPCFCCNASGANLYRWRAATPMALPWRANTDDDYFEACQRCEIHVLLRTADKHAQLALWLRFDQRDQGSHGLALERDFPELLLVRGDRLEPNPHLPNVGDFWSLSRFPRPILFLAPSSETLTRHRNPMFDRSIGITPRRCLTADTLHAIYLGILQRYCRESMWLILRSGLWGAIGTMDERIKRDASACRTQLDHWYRQRRGLYPDEGLTRISRMTKGRVGPTFAKRQCATKGRKRCR